MLCDSVESFGEVCNNNGFAVSREKCKEMCEATEYCTGFAYLHGSDSDMCYLTDVIDKEVADCQESEAWSLVTSCVLTTTTTTTTTTTAHDCWDFEVGRKHSTLDQVKILAEYDATSSWLSCKDYEIEDKSMCSDDNSWEIDRDTCKQRCDKIIGCQSFTYSHDEDKCWLSKLAADDVTESDETGFETWTTECTTTTFCELCVIECPNAEILDLRFVAWSNLGGQGPNKTIISNGQEHSVPPTTVYYNVFNATDADEVVYLIVSNLTEYHGNADINGVSRESEADFKERFASDPSSHPAAMEGAYGSFNLKAGSSVELQFEFMDHNMKPLTPDKVVAMTFLDIDQPLAADGSKDTEDPTAGMEQVSVCTGQHSFGWPASTELNHSWQWVSDDHTDVCHDFASRNPGDVEDNPWNPANERLDGQQGLEVHQIKKIFTAAFWHTSKFSARFSVRSEVQQQGFENRNFLFAGHATSFCGEEKSCAVKMDKCDAEASGSDDSDLKDACLLRERCEEQETEAEFESKQQAISEPAVGSHMVMPAKTATNGKRGLQIGKKSRR